MKEIKSQRAKEYLERTIRSQCSINGTRHISEHSAENAVQIAEQDARERAAKAYCEITCPGKAGICEVYGKNCPSLKRFLKLYDNE